MSEKLIELQKALDKFPNPDFSLDGVGAQMKVLLYDEWIKDFKEKFGVFQREHELSFGKEPSLRKRVENYLIEMYGNRKCEDFEPLCPACGAWAWFDKVFAMDIYKESREGKSE